MGNKIATQMYTIREYTETAADLAASLKKLAGIGYKAVQLSAVGAMNGPAPLVSAAEARRMLDDNGIRCIATHRSYDDLVQKTDEEIEFHHALGCDFAAIGGLPGPFRTDGAEGFKRFVDDAVPLIKRLKSAGIRFGYHNHDFEFERTGPGRKTLYDILIDEGGDLLLEIDLYWAANAGVNPERLVERASGRIPVLHVKDMEIAAGIGPVMAPVGEGNLDWEHLIPVCEAGGTEWYAVEQDTTRRDPFDCLRSSYNYLSGLMEHGA